MKAEEVQRFLQLQFPEPPFMSITFPFVENSGQADFFSVVFKMKPIRINAVVRAAAELEARRIGHFSNGFHFIPNIFITV